MPRTEAVPSAQVDPAAGYPDHRSQPALPWWVPAADVATLLLVAAAASVAVFGGFRVRLFGAVVTAHSSLRILVIAALVIAARHYFRRAPTLFARIVDGTNTLLHAESFRAIAPAFLWSRAAVLLTAYLSVVIVGYPTEIRFRVSKNEFANLPARWDAGWYLGIAQQGYRYDSGIRGQQNVAFFPAFPLVTRATGVLLGGNVDEGDARYSNPMRVLWAGVLVNLGALAAALGYLYRMVRAFADRDAALAAVQFALVYPLAFIFNAPYTEGLFLLAAVATFYHFGRAHMGAAAFWGAVAGLTRPNGFILWAPLLAIALARSGPFPRLGPLLDRLNWSAGRRKRLVADLAVSLAPVAGMLAFSAFLYGKWGQPFLWASLHAAWGRTYKGLEPALGPVDALIEHGVYGYTAIAGLEVLHVLFFLLAVGLSIPIAWRLGLAYTALILATVVPPLLAGGWLSMARMTLVLFPIYAYLGVAIPPSHRMPVMMAFAMLQGLGAALFFTWRPFY